MFKIGDRVKVVRITFEADDPYTQQVYVPMIGRTGVVIELRPEAEEPVRIKLEGPNGSTIDHFCEDELELCQVTDAELLFT